jgi:dTDP-4-amino-4,6-dideoxygalactose transaminase
MVAMPRLARIARKRKVHVVEDACHAHGATYSGKGPGRQSDAACYSFYPNKGLGGWGDGGMVITGKRKVRNAVRALRDPNSKDSIVLRSHRTPGYLKWNELAFLMAKLPHFRAWIDRRREIAARYTESFMELPLLLQERDPKARHTYRDFTVRTSRRNRLMGYLKRKGIETVVHYPKPVHYAPVYSYLGYKKEGFPNAEEACASVVSLPCNPLMTDDEVEYVIRMVKSFF